MVEDGTGIFATVARVEISTNAHHARDEEERENWSEHCK